MSQKRYEHTPTVGTTSGFKPVDIHTLPTKALNKDIIISKTHLGIFPKDMADSIRATQKVYKYIKPAYAIKKCPKCLCIMQVICKEKPSWKNDYKAKRGYTCYSKKCQDTKAKKQIDIQKMKAFQSQGRQVKTKHIEGVQLEGYMTGA